MSCDIVQVEEHLLLYARIKGVKETRLRDVADDKMKEMDLIPFRSVKVRGLWTMNVLWVPQQPASVT